MDGNEVRENGAGAGSIIGMVLEKCVTSATGASKTVNGAITPTVTENAPVRTPRPNGLEMDTIPVLQSVE